MSTPIIDSQYDSFLGVTIKRFYFIPSSGPNNVDSNLGSFSEWVKLLRQLYYNAPTGNVTVKIVPTEIFRDLTVEIYDSLYTQANVGSVTDNPVEASNSSIRLDTRGYTRAGFPGKIAISVDISNGYQISSTHRSSILARQFGQHYGYRSNVLTDQVTKQTIRPIHSDLLSRFTALRTALTQPAESGHFTTTQYRFAEDYAFLFGPPLTQGKFTPSAAGVAHPTNGVTTIGNSQQYITFMKTLWSLQRYLSSRAYSSLTFNDRYAQFKQDEGGAGIGQAYLTSAQTPITIYQALTESLIWYDWSTVNNQWIPIGSDVSQLNNFYTDTAPGSAPV